MKEKFWWLNDESRSMLERGYLLPGQTVEEKIKKICKYAATFYKDVDGIYDHFYELFSRGWSSLSSPIWANFGEERGLSISCFNTYIPDNMNGIYSTLHEVAIETQMGGGTSGYFGDLRAIGTPIKGGGKSSGLMSFLKLFDATANVVSQAGVRRGAFAGYVDITHPEIEEFLTIRDKSSEMQTILNAVCVPDDWMKSMEQGDKEKREIWAKVLKSRREKGVPYLFFSDTVNKNKPQIYKDTNSTIHASNLCLTGDTEVTISYNADGSEKFVTTMEELNDLFVLNKDIYIESYDVETETFKFSKLSASAMTGIVDELIEIEDGDFVIRCTPEHKILTRNRGYVMAKDLVETDELIKKGVVVRAKIKGIKLEKKIEVFDVTVPETSNFVANGVVVHNCNEIYLPTSENESFVCCLLSMNLATYDEWKDTDAVKYAVMFLDAVMSDFIKKVKHIPAMYRTYNFAVRHRALGLGVLGWHSLLQQRMIPFEGFEAQQLNVEVFKYIRDKAHQTSVELGDKYGYAPIFDEVNTTDTPRRNTTLMALAPTTSSSSILGQVSPSIEPFASNYFVVGLAKGSFARRNVELEKLLEERGKNTEEVWKSIVLNQGSVQHLDFLDQREKDVFKTFQEISPLSVIAQAAARQNFIDQGQSINLKIPSAMSIKDINTIHMEAWKLGLKGLYYQRGTSVAKEAILNFMNCSSCSA